jgi:hypothetical protein
MNGGNAGNSLYSSSYGGDAPVRMGPGEDAPMRELNVAGERSSGNAAQLFFLPQNAVLPLENTEVIDESSLPAKRAGGAR